MPNPALLQYGEYVYVASVGWGERFYREPQQFTHGYIRWRLLGCASLTANLQNPNACGNLLARVGRNELRRMVNAGMLE